MHCDAEDLVLAVTGNDTFLGVPAEDCTGRSFAEVVLMASEVLGDRITSLRDDIVEGGALRQAVFRNADGTPMYVQVYSQPTASSEGPAGAVLATAWSRRRPHWAPGADG